MCGVRGCGSGRARCSARWGFPVASQTCALAVVLQVDSLFTGENTGINFDAYEDIPVEVGVWCSAF